MLRTPVATEVEVVVVAKVTSSHGCRGMVPTEVAFSAAEPVTKAAVTASGHGRQGPR